MKSANRMLKKSEIFLVVLFLAVGFMVPTAYGSLLNHQAPVTLSPQKAPSEVEAEAACAMLRAVNGVVECHVMDFTAFDVVIPGVSTERARTFCKDAATSIALHFEKVSGKTYKVRVSRSGEVLTTASCRVPAFLG